MNLTNTKHSTIYTRTWRQKRQQNIKLGFQLKEMEPIIEGKKHLMEDVAVGTEHQIPMRKSS